MWDLFLGDTPIRKKIVELFMKKLKAETILTEIDITRDRSGNIIIEHNTLYPTKLTQEEKNQLKEDIRNYERMINDLEMKDIELSAVEFKGEDEKQKVDNFLLDQQKKELLQVEDINKNEEWKNIEPFKDINFHDNILKVWKEELDIEYTNKMKGMKEKFEKMPKKEYTNKSKFFIAFRTLLTIVYVWERNKNWDKICFNIDSDSFKKTYTKIWGLLKKFPIINEWKIHPNYITVTNNLLTLCHSKLVIPHKIKGQWYILSIRSITKKPKK